VPKKPSQQCSLDLVIASVEESTNTIDNLTNGAVDYMQRFANRLKQKTGPRSFLA